MLGGVPKDMMGGGGGLVVGGGTSGVRIGARDFIFTKLKLSPKLRIYVKNCIDKNLFIFTYTIDS